MSIKEGFRNLLQAKRTKEVVVENQEETSSNVFSDGNSFLMSEPTIERSPAQSIEMIPVDAFNPPADGRKTEVSFDQMFQDPIPDSLQEEVPEPEPDLQLSEDDILSIKTIAYSDLKEKELTMNELLEFVLYSTRKKKLSGKFKESLYIREMIDIEGKITKTGKIYLELDETKQRLIKYLNANR